MHAECMVQASQLPMLAPLFTGPDVEAFPWQRSLSGHYRMVSDPFFGLQRELAMVSLWIHGVSGTSGSVLQRLHLLRSKSPV